MGCGCGQTNHTPRQNKIVEDRRRIIDELDKGLVSFTVRSKCPYKEKFVKFVGTLSKNALPSSESRQYSRVGVTQKSDDIILWALNKNYDNNLDNKSGWVKISRKDIIEHKFISDIPKV